MLIHLVGVAGDDNFVGAEAERVFLLVRRGSKDDDVRSKRMSKFYRHVAESAETDHTNFLAFGDGPVMHGRVRRDAGAEQWRSGGEFQVRGDAQNEMFVDDDAFGVAAVGNASKVLVRRVEGEDHVRAELFKASFAVRAGSVRINHAAHRGKIPGLVLGNRRADFGDTADDLMAGNNRVIRGHELAPLIADRMEIGVADAAEEDLNLYVAVSWIATFDLGGRQPRCRTGSGVSLRIVRSWMHG